MGELKNNIVATERQFIFIIGAPRSGTTWLQSMISAHPRVASLGGVEQTLFSSYLQPLIERWEFEAKNIEKGRWEQGLPCIWTKSEFNNLIETFTRKVYSKFLEKNKDATHILDKHPEYSNCTSTIKNILPNAKFVHLTRDGRDVAVSLKSVKERVGFGTGTVWGAAYEWKKCLSNAKRAKKFGREYYLELTYDELLLDGYGNLMRLFEFLNLEYDEALVRSMLENFSYKNKPVSEANVAVDSLRGGYKPVWKTELSLKERYIFHLVAGFELRENGMEENSNWWAYNGMDRLIMLPYPILSKLKRSVKLAIKSLRDPLY